MPNISIETASDIENLSKRDLFVKDQGATILMKVCKVPTKHFLLPDLIKKITTLCNKQEQYALWSDFYEDSGNPLIMALSSEMDDNGIRDILTHFKTFTSEYMSSEQLTKLFGVRCIERMPSFLKWVYDYDREQLNRGEKFVFKDNENALWFALTRKNTQVLEDILAYSRTSNTAVVAIITLILHSKALSNSIEHALLVLEFVNNLQLVDQIIFYQLLLSPLFNENKIEEILATNVTNEGQKSLLIQSKFVCLLANLDQKVNDSRGDDPFHSHPSSELFKTSDELLRELKDSFITFQKDHNIDKFKQRCEEAITIARPVLSTHRGGKDILSIAIQIITILPLLCLALNWAYKSIKAHSEGTQAPQSFFYCPKTESEERLDNLSETLEQLDKSQKKQM